MAVGIESINAYVGRASLGVRDLFQARGLQMQRFDNLMMERKSVNLPCEDPVSNAVNAARPLIDALPPDDRDRIELVVVGTESGLDFGKPISTYIHDYLRLTRRCRSFEVKHACYGGTAALQTAAAIVAASPEEGAKALVIATDAASAAARDSYWEPSQGAGAVAMLVSRDPAVLELDAGASGFYSHEVMDTLRPRPDLEAGDTDLSLLSYLNCLEQTFKGYCQRVEGVDLMDSFSYLVLHTPFAGMVRGAHRKLLRSVKGLDPDAIAADFDARVRHCLYYCSQVGNVYSAALYLALCSLIDHVRFTGEERIGLFSYGSGCASEFYSGVVAPAASEVLGRQAIGAAIADRYPLSMDEYEVLSDLSLDRMAGMQDHQYDVSAYESVYKSHFDGRGLLVLDKIDNFHRLYRWT
jgi:polyketide biosynthesis 3-hydroxy-3-methylglutaryl-CoA synthase-like enzyme PksG